MKIKYILLLATIIITIVSCTNKNADYNNSLFDIHAEFQNNIKTLNEKLETDSITTDSALVFLAKSQGNCLAQYNLFKKLAPTTQSVPFHNAVNDLLQKQLNTFNIQNKMYANTEPDKDLSILQDSLDANQLLIDSLDMKVKAAQVEFAKKNKFTLQ